jgi:polysaccharide export outer membrane protein
VARTDRHAAALGLFVIALLAVLSMGSASAYGQDYRIGIGDTISVSVFGEPQLSRVVMVPANCQIDVPLIGGLDVCGHSTREVAADVTARYADGYLVQPQVIVEVQTYGSQKVTVSGAVRKPGIELLIGPTTLSEVLASAGGTSGDNVVEVEVTRAGATVETYLIAQLDLMPIPVYVNGGDTVSVKPGSVVYVKGEVKSQGPIAWHEGLTVSQVVFLAGGIGEYGAQRLYILRGSDLDRQKIPVNLRAIEDGKKPDYAVLPDDQLTIRRSIF